EIYMTDSQKLDLLLDKVFLIDTKVDSLDSRVDSFESKLNSLESKVDSLESRVSLLEHNMESLKSEVIKTNLLLENETNRNIKIVAEGHLDLSRKLDESIKFSTEIKARQETHEIYINRHERMLSAL
ncbi:MAG: DUF4988 domain-containing protein, partial [Lachnospiraceae bacterium]|nr:DUF4988 domain-containing protein [Lachnospiraceae bacterium]